MNLYEAIDELKDHGYLLTEWKITSDFDELSKADKESLTKAMNGAYTARKSGNKKNLAKYSAILKELLKKLSNPKAIKAVNKMLGKMDDKMGGATTTSTKLTSTTTTIDGKGWIADTSGKISEKLEMIIDALEKEKYIENDRPEHYIFTEKGKEALKVGSAWSNFIESNELWLPTNTRGETSTSQAWNWVKKSHVREDQLAFLIDKFNIIDVLTGKKTTTSGRLTDYVSSKKYITDDDILAFLDKLIKIGYIIKEDTITYAWTSEGKEFTNKKFGSKWNLIYSGKELWVPSNFDKPDSDWYFTNTITVTNFEKYKAFFEVESTSGETSTTSTTVRDPKTVNALCTIFRLFIRALEQHKWIEYVPETNTWIWTSSGKMLTKRKWGSAWGIYIRDVKDKYTITPDSYVWIQQSTDTKDWGYVAIKDVSKLEIENTVKGFNLKTVYKTSGVLRYLTDKRLAGTPAPSSASATSASIPQLLYAFYKKMLDLDYINTDFGYTYAGHELTKRKIGTTWSEAAGGLKFSDYESFETDLIDGRIRPWLPKVGSDGKRPGDWYYYYYKAKTDPIQLSQVKAAITLFDIKIDGIPTSSVSSTRETKPTEPAKPKDLELPATMEFIQYHFMISMTIEDSDDSDKMDPNIEKALDACTKIENMLEILNKRYAPYGLKCTCDWDNDDAHYFYGKYWQVNSGTLSSGTSVGQYFDKYAKLPEEYKHAEELFKSNALNPSMNNRIIDNKVEKLRNYKAHRID